MLAELKVGGVGPADRAKVRLLVGDREHLRRLSAAAAATTAPAAAHDDDDDDDDDDNSPIANGRRADDDRDDIVASQRRHAEARRARGPELTRFEVELEAIFIFVEEMDTEEIPGTNSPNVEDIVEDIVEDTEDNGPIETLTTPGGFIWLVLSRRAGKLIFSSPPTH
eukprot:SAG22_NODE_519_length_9510_cov_6.192222_1_plen_166_part_10